MIELKPGWTYVSKNGNVRRTIISIDGDRVTWCNNDRRTAFTFNECTAKGFHKWMGVSNTARLHNQIECAQLKKAA
jgi:hypothetical protein